MSRSTRDVGRFCIVRRDRSRRYQRVRAMVLAEEPLCRPCTARGRVAASDEVDHIVALEDGGNDDRDNLQGICGDCHKVKHGGMPRIGVDGWPLG